MRAVSYFLAIVVGILGFVFLLGNQGEITRIIVGIVLLVAAGVMFYLGYIQSRPAETPRTQKIDLSGDVRLEEIRCRSCNAALSKDQIDVKAGAIFVECDHCGATYQIEEEPKW